MLPKVSLIWLNYNSEFETDKTRLRCDLDIAEESLNSVRQLEYPNYELIILDNNSSNDNIGRVKDLIRDSNLARSEVKLLRQRKNYGSAGAR